MTFSTDPDTILSLTQAVLIEEQKQRSLMDICEKSHPEDGGNCTDAATLAHEILAVGLIEAQTVKGGLHLLCSR